MTVVYPNILRASCRFSMAQGQDHVNVYYFRADTGYSETDVATLGYIEDHMDSIYGNLTAHLSNTADAVDIKVDVVAFVGGVETIIRNVGTTPFNLTVPPAATGEPLPPGVAGLVKLLTGIGKVYGRKFIGMLTEGAQNSGVLGVAVLAALEVVAAIMVATITAPVSGDLIPGVMSKRETDFVAFASYDVSSNMAYQRRRRAGTGS